MDANYEEKDGVDIVNVGRTKIAKEDERARTIEENTHTARRYRSS